ncbi:MAG: hypothetical protein WC438_04115 [Candidatus Pacearchaeota archaeon]
MVDYFCKHRFKKSGCTDYGCTADLHNKGAVDCPYRKKDIIMHPPLPPEENNTFTIAGCKDFEITPDTASDLIKKLQEPETSTKNSGKS